MIRRTSHRLLRIAILLACACSLLACGSGCGRRVVIVHGSEGICRLRANEPAPADGWWVSDVTFAELFEAARMNLSTDGADSAAEDNGN